MADVPAKRTAHGQSREAGAQVATEAERRELRVPALSGAAWANVHGGEFEQPVQLDFADEFRGQHAADGCGRSDRQQRPSAVLPGFLWPVATVVHFGWTLDAPNPG